MQIPSLSPEEPLRLSALRELNVVETPIEERFERITRLAKRLLHVEIAAVSLVEADRQWFKSIQGLDVSETSRDVSFCGHTILQPEVVVVRNAREDPRFENNPLVTGPPFIAFYAACPIKSPDGYLVGSLCVIDDTPRDLTDDDTQTIRDLAALAETELQSASAAAVQASLIDDVTSEQRRALIDSLTRVWNREGIMQIARQALEHAKRTGTGAGLVMVDLDNFKQINDTHGHAAGDEVLRASARRMLAAVRESDVVGRLGGDEFLLVLSPCDDDETGRIVAERARERLISSQVKFDGGTVQVTASLGVRVIGSGNTDSLEQLVDSVDRAMYQSKQAGRNQIAEYTGSQSTIA